MKKIGILTFHKSINYGAFMQCYALSNRLAQDFPDYKIEVIDYATQRVFENYTLSVKSYLLGSKSNPKSLINSLKSAAILMRNPHMLKEMEVLITAFKKEWTLLPLSHKSIVTDNYLSFFDQIRGEYEAIIVGSDGVWEFVSYPFPNAYYLNSDLGTKKLSYAASSDRMYYNDLNSQQIKYIKNALSGYSYLGVRDVATENFIRSIDPSLTLDHNCDPTVTLDMEKIPSDLERVREILAKAHIDVTKPIIGLMGDDNIGKLIRDIFGNRYSVVAVYTNSKYADLFINDLTPMEWAKIFSLFSITFTRFFHGTILSLKNGTPTITLDPWRMRDDSHKTKIKDFYDRLDLTEHYFIRKKSYDTQEISEIRERAELFISNPDRLKISKALETEATSYNSFRQAINGILKDR